MRRWRNWASPLTGWITIRRRTWRPAPSSLRRWPGSASVLGLLNDTEHRVTLVLDRAVAESRWFGCHPCRNTSSLRLRTEDVLEKFLPHTGHVPLVVEL